LDIIFSSLIRAQGFSLERGLLMGRATEGGRSGIHEFNLKAMSAEGTPFSRFPRKQGDEDV
jgi:hypothetical protein